MKRSSTEHLTLSPMFLIQKLNDINSQVLERRKQVRFADDTVLTVQLVTLDMKFSIKYRVTLRPCPSGY